MVKIPKYLIFFLSLLLVSFTVISCDNVETVVIENNSSGEKIYLKKFSRGLNYERSVLTKNSDLSINEIDKEAYQDNTGSPCFYKLSNDTLHIYGGHWERKVDSNFNTSVYFHELSNPEFIKLSKVYEEKGLNLFPPSHKKFIN